MKRKKIKWAVLLSALLLSFSGCINLAGKTEGSTAAENHTTVPNQPQSPDPMPDTPSEAELILKQYLSVFYVYRSNVREARLTTGMAREYLLLANKTHPLSTSYVPKSLSKLTVPTHHDEELQLEARAAAALEELFREMRFLGITDVTVTSAYRSYEYQMQLHRHYLKLEQSGFSKEAYLTLGAAYIQNEYINAGKTGLDLADAERVVATYSAMPGESEHQTGLCVDFITDSMNDQLTVAFEDTEAFAYLSKNAHKFGFILRYPKGEEDVTGYTYEPWHYRFVGREAATNIYLSGLTLEEYLEKTSK